MLEKLQEHEGEEALKRKGKETLPRDQDGGSAPGLEPTCHQLLVTAERNLNRISCSTATSSQSPFIYILLLDAFIQVHGFCYHMAMLVSKFTAPA